MNGQFDSFKELLKELKKSERQNFVDYVFEYVQSEDLQKIIKYVVGL